MLSFKKRKLIKIGIGLVISVTFITGLSAYLSNKRELPIYVGIEQTTEEETTGYSIDTKKIVKGNATFSIPKDWEYVNEDGTDTYINTSNQAFISVYEYSYTPKINQLLSENTVSSIVGNNGSFKTSYKNINSSTVTYSVQKNIGNMLYNSFSYVTWDLDEIIEYVVNIPAVYYEQYQDLPDFLFSQINVIKQNPISENYYIYYEENTNTQFGVPIDWNFSNNGQINLTNGNKTITVGTNKYISYNGINQIQYSQMVGSNAANFVLSTFSADSISIKAEATFTSNNTKMYMKQYMISTGNLSLVFTLTCPYAEKTDTVAAIFDIVTGYYKYWGD